MKSKGIPLYTKLMMILLAVILPICIVGIRTNQMQQQSALLEVQKSQLDKVTFYGDAIVQEIDRMQKSTYQCVNDSDFVKLSVFWDVLSDYERAETINKARDKLNLLREMSPYAANLSIYMPSMGKKINAVNCDLEVTKAEMEALQNQQSQSGLLTVYKEKLYVCSVYPEGTQLKLNPSMLMAIEINQAYLVETLQSVMPDQRGGAFILGDTWRLSAREVTDEAALAEIRRKVSRCDSQPGELVAITYQGEKCLLNWVYYDEIGAYIVCCTPWKAALVHVQRMDILIGALILITLIVTIIAAVWEYCIIHLPVKRMVAAFAQVEKGNYHVRLEAQHPDEFEHLYGSFNHMVTKIQELVDQVYKQKILSQQAQLKQLQSQINPHFFYNSFFIIQGMMNMGEYDAANQMLGTLGRYFQFVTRSGREFVSIQREVGHAYAYCEVQQIRFRNIQIQFDNFEDDLVGMQVPRLILQPLIENAFVHGLENVMEGKLHIWAEITPPYVMIHVDNTGTVITDEEMAEVRRKLDMPDDGLMEVTALINIHRRLKLHYGEDCGLRIERLPDGMTRTTLILRWEGDEHVQNTGS